MKTMIVYALVIAFAISLVIELASAQVTTPEGRACLHDAIRFCRHDLNHGPFTVGMCLSANKVRLTAGCRRVIEAHGL